MSPFLYHEDHNHESRDHQLAPPPPPPERPPPNPPKPPPPNPPPPNPPPPNPPPKPPPNGPTPLIQRFRRRRFRPIVFMMMMNSTTQNPIGNRRRCGAACAVATAAPFDELNVAAVGDSLGDARGALDQAAAVIAVAKRGRHRPARFAGEAVGDEALESVPGFDPYLPIVEREQRSGRRCPCLSRRCPCRGSRTSSTAYDGMSAIRLERLDGRHDHHVAGRVLQLAHERFELPASTSCRSRRRSR